MIKSPVQVHQPEWVIVSFSKPILWDRTEGEAWMFNPNVRYILNKGQLDSFSKDQIETVSELKNGRYFTQLQASRNLANASILVERHRDRGYGDLLFLTGPLNYLRHMSGGSASIDLYALSDRGQLLDHHPALSNQTTLVGPITYDGIQLYNYHWFIDSVTEYDEERDQLNVYDALYRQIGVDPGTVDPQFKRPTIQLVNQDFKDLDSLYYFIYLQKKIDLRRSGGYYVVAPTSNGSIRSAPYGMWLSVIMNLAKARPVVVVGQSVNERVPSTDMPYGTFIQNLDALGNNVINLTGAAPMRVLAALIARSTCTFTLDSGLLYVAQALRVPAVSLWGATTPQSRIGYDKDYMDLAIWNRDTCNHAGCFAFRDFPRHKCARGDLTTVCEPLRSVTPDQVIDMARVVESRISASIPSA